MRDEGRQYIIAIGALCIIAVLFYSGFQVVQKPSGQGLSLLDFFTLQFGIPLALTLAAIFLKPLRLEIVSSISEVRDRLFDSACRVYIYGNGRTGKTTLIGSLVAIKTPERGVRTTEAKDYKVRVLLDFSTNRYISLHVMDYKGQAPEDAIFLDDSFAGSKSNPRIDIIVFLVDMIEEVKKDETNFLTDEELVDYYSDSADEKIEARIADNKNYVNDVAMRLVLSRLHNPKRLVGVVFAINKIDIIEKLIENGAIATDKTPEEYALSKYSDTIENLDQLCSDSNLGGKKRVWCISLTKGASNTRNQFAELFDKYLAQRA